MPGLFLVLGTVLSLIGSAQDFNIGFVTGDEPAFLKAGISSLPSTITLIYAVGVLGLRRRQALRWGVIGCLFGVASIAYQSTFLSNMNTGYLTFGFLAATCGWALQSEPRKLPTATC